MRSRYSLALASTLTVLLSACGGSGGSIGGGPLPTHSSTPMPSSPPVQQSANVEFVFHIPPIASASQASMVRNGVHKKDISAAAQSITIAIGTQVLTTADVSATSSLCGAASGGGRNCAVGITAPSGTDQFVIKAYDQPKGAGNAIAQGTVQEATSAQPAPVNVALTGTITKLAVALSNAFPSAGTAATVNVVVNGFDVDGNVVLGSYASPITLADSDTSGGTSLSTTTVANSSTTATLSYTGAAPFESATITASQTGVASATATFAPAPAFLSTYDLPTVGSGRFAQGPGPQNITKGPDGNMWVVTTSIAEVIKVASDGTFTTYPTTNPQSQLQCIAVGSDGYLWFAEPGNNAIGKISTSGTITEYPLPQNPASPECVGLGKDGNMWFDDDTNGVIGSITPSGKITEYPAPANTFVNHIATGSGGNLWMTDIGNNAILVASTSGQIVASYPIPTKNAFINGIAEGPDGNIWFTEFNANKIGRITPAGTLTEFPTPAGSGAPFMITAGPDGKMWFAEMGPFIGVGRVGYITIDGKQTRDFLGDGNHVRDLAFDATGKLWYIAVQVPFGAQEVGTLVY